MLYSETRSEQKGVSKLVILGVILGGILVLALLVAGIGVMAYVGASNKGNQLENQIDQLSQSSASSLSNYALRITEMAQVPDKAKNDMKELVEAQMSGRYGPDGSKAVFQFMKEQNLPVDQRLYLNIQSEMSAGRKEFEITQNRLMSTCRAYKNELGNVWSGFWLGLAGYPKVNLEIVFRAITDDKTKDAFSTGKQTKVTI